jgi:hypothetical protein
MDLQDLEVIQPGVPSQPAAVGWAYSSFAAGSSSPLPCPSDPDRRFLTLEAYLPVRAR